MTSIWKKSIGKNNIRKYAFNVENILKRDKTMSKQAKSLTSVDVKRVLEFIALKKHSARNRAMFLVALYAGLRVGEVASLRYMDVLGVDDEIRDEIRLDASITKGNVARTVFVNTKLRKELANYIKAVPYKHLADKLFYTQKNEGFTANTLTQFFYYLFGSIGIAGASSHSMRRTFITTLANKGVSVRLLASLVGHKNISTTQFYIDVNDDQKRSAVELV
ncbi:XerD Site-specific recombinase XerD [Candidatus Methylopumilus planktonicus]|jgi:integrase/recombinase XerD